MFESQKSKNNTSLGDFGLNIRAYISSKVGQDQVSGGKKTFLDRHELVKNGKREHAVQFRLRIGLVKYINKTELVVYYMDKTKHSISSNSLP